MRKSEILDKEVMKNGGIKPNYALIIIIKVTAAIIKLLIQTDQLLSQE